VGYGTLSLLRTVLKALPATMGTLPILLPADVAVELDGRVLTFAVGVSVLCGTVFGLAPALSTVRGMRAIASGRRATATMTNRQLRNGLIVAQVALAFVMLISAGLLIRSLDKMRSADTGFNATNVLAVQLLRSERHFAAPSQVRTFMREVITGLRVTPGIVDAAFVDGMPMNGAARGTFFQRATDPLVERAQRPLADLKIVGPGYFHVLGLQVRRGRTLSEIDHDKAPLVAVINETLARMFFTSDDPIGQRLLMDGPNTTSTAVVQAASYEIVGVIADERLTPFDDRRAHPVVYVSNEQNPRDFIGVILRASLDGQRLESAVRSIVAAVDRGVAVTDVRTMDQLLSESMTPERYRSVLFGALAAVAVLLAAIGIYGVVSYSVAQRTREIGIRAALGATPGKLVRWVVSEGVTLAAIGLALGAGAATGLTRILDAFLFGIERSDAITWLAAATVLGSVAIIGCYIPARRAASVDPIAALRAE
jgi:putative ABC transport system permease protein